MTAETGAKWLLRFISITTIPAFLAAVMPQPWLASMIDKVEPGLSTGIVVTYLARGLMGMYALAGLCCFVCSTDVRRYRPLIMTLGISVVIAALVALTALVAAVPPEGRTGMFWIVFVDLAEGSAHTLLLVILVSRVRG